MLRALAPRTRSARRRSGAVLIVVLAMLVLFAVLGLSFVLYSEAQLSAAKGVKLSRNEETEPNPQAASEEWVGSFIFDRFDTGDDLMNPVRGHSLARSKYGYQAGLPSYLAFTAGYPYQPPEGAGFNFNGITDSKQIVRFTWDTTTGSVFDPERFYNANMAALRQGAGAYNNPLTAANGVYQGKNYPYTYPDRHDFYLAYQDPTSGRVVVPSFHRDALGSWNPTAANYFETQGPAGKFRTLRPRVVDGHTNFPPVPPNADGSYTGDVANLKFITGSQQNDSYWMDAGGPVLKWRGKFYKAMVAPLVLDLSGRANLSIAGNLRNTNNTLAGVYPHGSGQGWGPWELNPLRLGDGATLTAADLQAVVQRRYGTSATPQADPYTAQAYTTRLNHGFQPPLSSRIDPDGNVPSGADAAMSLPLPPPADGFTTYPGFASTRFAPDQVSLTARLQNHPAQFNPLLPARQAISASTPTGGLGLDALAATASRPSTGVTKRPAGYGYDLPSLMAAPGTPNAQLVRSLVTAFSTSQEFRTVTVTNVTGSVTAQTVLGPVDLNRPLPDYRRDATQPYSAVNMWNLSVGADLTAYRAVQFSRQTLAHDIFLRLAASLSGGINGNVAGSAGYDPTTGHLVLGDAPGTGNYNVYRSMAQLAANLVDYIDGDDVATVFVWNPFTPAAADPLQDFNNFSAAELANRVVYGTEQPRLVINEAYCGIFNEKTERALAAPNVPSRTPKRQYWVELHNPTPANDPARADAGAARLQYVPGQGGYPATATRFNPYRVEVATVPAGTANAYTTAISSVVPGGTTITNPAVATSAIGASVVLQAQVNQYTDATANPFVAGAANDEGNLVRPATGTSGTPGQNVGYYLLGPDDQFLPTTPPLNTVGLLTPPDGTALPAQNTLAVDAAPAIWTSDADVVTEAQKTNVVILRRLANPYLQANDPNEAGYNNALPVNQYITVDYVENLPTADRVNFLNNLAMRTHTAAANTSDFATTGRVHPFAHGVGPNATAGVGDGLVFQGPASAITAPNMVTPAHTFFQVNLGARNSTNAGVNGFYWLPHLDREAVNATEAFWATLDSPAGRTRVVTYDATTGNQNLPEVYRRKVDFDNNLSPRGHVFGLLTTGPRLPGSAVGGREAGRVNLNTVNHPSVLNALLDPQVGNSFYADANLSAQAWGFLSGTAGGRTPTGTPGATVYETGTATDDSPFWLTGTGLLYSTRLRMTGTPAAYAFGSYAATTPAHDYFQTEPLRKVWNSTTTVSDSFLVVMTVGFFEVTPTNPALPISVTNQPLFGAELFDKVPGDLRAQFASVVDRSNLTVADPLTAPTTPGAGAPFQTKLTADAARAATAVEIEALPPGGLIPTGFVGAGTAVPANTCAILGNGQVLYVTNGSRLWVGYGNSYDTTAPGDGEWLTVAGVAAGSKPGTAAVTVAATTRPHGGGTLVTNLPFGNPGPQTGVTLPQLQQRGLVPYFTRLEP